MQLFTHVETGQALDIQPAPDLASYQRFLNAPQNWIITTVTPDIVDGATAVSNGDGTYKFTNPPAAAPAAKLPVKMPGKTFTNYCAGVLEVVDNLQPGQNLGLVRFDQIIAAMKASTAPLMSLAQSSFQAALSSGGVFTQADAVTFFAALVNAGCMKQAEATALVAGWILE